VTAPPPQLIDALRDRYVIERELGRGGMAAVYLARDLRHERLVALKVLRPELAALIGAERFLHEIRVTANLQHPHILPLHDSGETLGLLWYVMPFVEGETLRAKIHREKQLGIDEAVTIARGVASALDYAHRHGVIHRDVKPENVLLHDGQALVADFGIALAVSQAGGHRLTETGLSIGTPQYMSPEQAMGDRELDGRSDTYSLGAVVYEMLTGDPPYTGSTAQAIVAKVITEKPTPVTTLRDTVPPHVAVAVHKALAKLPADRYHTAAEFADALMRSGAGAPLLETVTVEGVHQLARRATQRWVPLAAVAVLAALATWGWLRPARSAPLIRFGVALPASEALKPTELGLRIALSPDGSRLVYFGPGEKGGQLWLKQRDQLHAVPLSGTDDARNPFFSPDGQRLGFMAGNPLTLKVMSFGGEPPVNLTDSTLTYGGATWGRDGFIYFDTDAGLQRIKESGGSLEPVALLDSTRKELGIAWPEILPSGNAVLFRMRRPGQQLSDFEIAALDLPSGVRKTLTKGVFARYAASGHLVYVTADGKLLAARFDPRKLAITGPRVALAEGIAIRQLGAVDLAVSSTGTLVYVPGSLTGGTEVVWVNRTGVVQPLDPDWKSSAVLNSPALSPDGRSLAIGVIDAAATRSDVWVKRGLGGPLSRLTIAEDSTSDRPTWTADGRSLLFVRGRRAGVGQIEIKLADGTRPERLVARTAEGLSEVRTSPDGKWLVLRTPAATSSRGDILAMRVGADSAPVPLIGTRATEVAPTLSPDGRWLAYASDESGRMEVYARPFPDVESGKWQISTGGGTEPLWAHSGRELFYRDGEGNLVAAETGATTGLVVGRQVALFSALPFAADALHQQYDVTPDDQRFIMLRPVRSDAREDLVMVENWFDELKTKVPR
jgi:serine/threonine-protein kinase